MRARKYQQVIAVIERRVREGDYLLKNIPGERKIADETGVSYMTARRAVNELLDREVLIRRTNGALDVHPKYVQQQCSAKVVLLYPAYPSPHLLKLRRIVNVALESHHMILRPVQYVHWDDPIVANAIGNNFGAFIIPSTEDIPSRVLAALAHKKVVILDGDLSDAAIRSLQLFPDAHVEQVFDHLFELGHRHIDCINTQHQTREVDRRIELWRRWRNSRGIKGRLWNEPAPSFADPTPVAHRMVSRLIDEKRTTATAVVCTTFPAAIGAIRAHWERGRKIGADISICSMNIESPARYCCPSVTGLDVPNLDTALDRCLGWFSDRRAWRGRLLLAPDKPDFFAGESSGTCCGGAA